MARFPRFGSSQNRSAKIYRGPSEPPPFSLICKDGRVMQFYVKTLAEMYQSLYGGTLLKE